MSFFQKISDKQFDYEADFVVKESKTMRLVIGLVLLAIAIAMIQSSWLIAAIIGTASIASLIASRRNLVIMTINKKGFYYYGNMLTNWKNFVSAEFLDEAPTISSSSTGFSDRFSLYMKYYKDGHKECFGRKIPLTNTQDKAEEEILAAIRFYYRNSTIAH